MACPKHFALNSIENSRWIIDVSINERALREVYIPHFKKVIQKGKPASIMSAYNRVRGNYSGSNKELLTNILRDDWGFKGFVSTDWMYGIYDGIEAINAGLNVEMPWQDEYSYDVIRDGLNNNKIEISQIDNLVLSTLKTRLKYAFSYDSIEYSKKLILDTSHINLAKTVAEESMVLIKNKNILPFKIYDNMKVGVIGKIANLENTGDMGSSNSNSPYVVTPFQGITNFFNNSNVDVIYDNGKNLEETKKIAEKLDQIILVVGYTYEDEGEYVMSRGQMLKSAEAKELVGIKGIGGDRLSLRLNNDDENLIKTLSKINENIVVVYVGGSGINMNNWIDDIPAVLFSWYSGMEGGNALANILYGKANPSGKLPFSIAKNDSDYPYFNPYTDTITYGYYHGYTLFEKFNKEILFPFGYGLSYSDFKIDNFRLMENNSNNNKIEFKVDIENISKIYGNEVIQLYVGFENSKINRPLKLLRDFKKVGLKPGEKKTIILKIFKNDLAYFNEQNKEWEIENLNYNFYVGNSSSNNSLIKYKNGIDI